MADIIEIFHGDGTKEVREATAEEQAQIDENNLKNHFDIYIKNLRFDRNQLLKESDWTQMPDSPLTDAQKTEWQTYRQSLRDLTNGLTTQEEVEAVVFPEEPTT